MENNFFLCDKNNFSTLIKNFQEDENIFFLHMIMKNLFFMMKIISILSKVIFPHVGNICMYMMKIMFLHDKKFFIHDYKE